MHFSRKACSETWGPLQWQTITVLCIEMQCYSRNSFCVLGEEISQVLFCVCERGRERKEEREREGEGGGGRGGGQLGGGEIS